jgi:thymidylate synthase (FAD)
MNVKLISKTVAIIDDMQLTGDEYIAYCARVSNPTNQMNNETAPKLLKYLIAHSHWSPFEMVHLTMEINTTRDIARQILRHRSFTFQEFSQRYAQVSDEVIMRPARLQDTKNRQNSLVVDPDSDVHHFWEHVQRDISSAALVAYRHALEKGIAREVARAILPEGLTPSRLYMSGSVRSWYHYTQLRMGNGTQLEHKRIAEECFNVLVAEHPCFLS